MQFSITEINTEIKITAAAVIKNELKYFLMSEGNTRLYSRAKPRGITPNMIQ